MFKVAFAGFLILVVLFFSSCNKCNEQVDYRAEMRLFVQSISSYAKSQKSSFIVITQNGQELAQMSSAVPATDYLIAIDGQAREDIYYGYEKDDKATSIDVSAKYEDELDFILARDKAVWTIDYCSGTVNVSDAYAKNRSKNYVSFCASDRGLATIPSIPINMENDSNILTLKQAHNFLYLINGSNYSSKRAFIDAVKNTNYDAIIMDLFQNEEMYTAAEINELKIKNNGARRLVLCYMSIGEAENYRYYWEKKWNSSKPQWLGKLNAKWPGNYKVCYWNKDWQNIITGNSDSYIQNIMDASFDGTYLDIIDAFEYYEERN